MLEQPLSLHLSAHRHTILLDGPLRLGEIDLAAPDPLPLSGTLEAAATISRDGDANALVLWWEVGLGADERTPTISTGPTHGQRPHWKQVVYPLMNTKAADAAKGLCAGERLSLRASYNRDRLRLQVVGRASPAAVGVVAEE